MIKKKRKNSRRSPKLDTIMNEERGEKLENFLDEQLPDCKESWENLKVILQRAAKHVFDKRKRKGTDWFYDQEESIRNLLKDKKLSGDRQALRNEIRKLKNEWFQQKAEDAERYSNEKNHREFYATLNAVYGPKSKNLHAVRAKDGVLLSSTEDIKKRRTEHFSELLNQPTDVDLSILDDIEQNPIIEKLDDPITMEEVEKAINNTKVKKSSGPDGIIPEVLVYGGHVLRSFLLAIFNQTWQTELMPSDLTDANI